MAYVKHTWQNGQPPAINAEHLNEMEDGIEQAINSAGTKLYKHIISDGNNTIVLISTQSTSYNILDLAERLKRFGMAEYITDGIFLPFEGFLSVKLDMMTGNYSMSVITAQISGTSVSLVKGMTVNMGVGTTDTVTSL